MTTFKKIVLFVLLAIVVLAEARKPCPCYDASLCEVFSTPKPGKEFFAWSVSNSTYKDYDWDVLTTISIIYDPTTMGDLICVAHAKNVRVTIDVGPNVTTANVGNITWVQEWIDQTIEMVQDNYLDGLVFDVEQNMQGLNSALFTGFIAQVAYQFKNVNPNYWVSLDTSYVPYIGWNFDYIGISDAVDKMIMMDYDMTNPINDPMPFITEGIEAFLALGIPKTQLIAALPWYGFDNICETGSTLENVTCNTVGNSNDILLADVMAIIANPNIQNTGPLWSEQLEMPFLMYISPADGLVHQAWYDNPQSIAVKVAAIKSYDLSGIGVFDLDLIVGTNLPENIIQEMWDATASYLTNQ
eukprot:gene15336-18179_t